MDNRGLIDPVVYICLNSCRLHAVISANMDRWGNQMHRYWYKKVKLTRNFQF